jgi:hypothetical protein
LLLCFVFGLFSPRVFRQLGKMEPFNRVSPVALQFGFVRRRLFAEYLAELESELRHRRSGTNNEVYVPIPAEVLTDQGARELVVEPALPLCRHLTDRDLSERRNIFIESPGGRGKSALMRQIVQLAIDQFKVDPCSSLPVFCSLVKDQSVQDMIRQRLGRHVLSDDAFDQQLIGGHFIAVLDGLSEYDLQPERLRDFIVSEGGQATCLLMTTRPNITYRQAVQTAGRVVLVEPQRLKDDQTLERFQKTYLEEDLREPGSIAAPLSEDMKNACRSADGSYLPLLVRLAIRVGGGGEGSVAAVYAKTFQLLLSRKGEDDPQLLEQAARLCMSTYWQNGIRPIAFAGVTPERQRVLQSLRNAGILVDEGVTRLPDSPRMVRFFHDSMQSYLTALGIFRGYAANEDQNLDGWHQLSRAAGDPVFKGQSDISSGVGAELFQMCLHVCIPPQQLKKVFQDDLRTWARSYERGLSKDDVLHACPEDLRQALELHLDPGESAGVFLEKAVKLCSQDGAERELRYLGILYGGMALLIWQLANRETVESRMHVEVPALKPPIAIQTKQTTSPQARMANAVDKSSQA